MGKEKTTPKRRAVIDFQSEEEMKKVQMITETFELQSVPKDSDVSLPPMLLLVWGEEKTGKTHLLSSMSEVMPVYILDTEYRAEYVQRKFQNVHLARCKTFLDIFLSVKGIIAKYPKGIVVMDSGTDLHKFAQERVLEEQGMEKLWPRPVWDLVYHKERAVLDALKDNGFHVGITARAKDEYLSDSKSGKKIPNCFNELPYKADLVIRCNDDKTKVVERNGWGVTFGVQFKVQDTLPAIINHMKGLP